MAEYVQEMAGVVCLFDSGELRVISLHSTSHDARAELDRMRRSGEAASWISGTLRVLDCGICHVHVDLDVLNARLERA